VIELDAVSFAYGSRSILAGLSLRVAAGELCGVLGPNGAGKSTLARLALGLLTPTSGTVRLGGGEIGSLTRRQIALRVAALLQEESAAFPMTVKECVLLGRVAHLAAHGFEAESDLAAADAAMREVGVAQLADRVLHALSGGERRRVLLARTLAQAAPALVLDEPAANLDLAHQLELFAVLRARARAGSAVLVTIHDLNLAARWCDRVVLLGGTAPAIGAPADVLTPARLREVFGVEIELARTGSGTAVYVAAPLTPR
jgi:iron complex transport system ATP-binding protein